MITYKKVLSFSWLRFCNCSMYKNLMQVNWYWQFSVMGSPWRITDPAVNIKIAAQILKAHYRRTGDWWEAVGRYHRPADRPEDRMIADKYRQRVRRFFKKANSEKAEANAA